MINKIFKSLLMGFMIFSMSDGFGSNASKAKEIKNILESCTPLNEVCFGEMQQLDRLKTEIVWSRLNLDKDKLMERLKIEQDLRKLRASCKGDKKVLEERRMELDINDTKLDEMFKDKWESEEVKSEYYKIKDEIKEEVALINKKLERIEIIKAEAVKTRIEFIKDVLKGISTKDPKDFKDLEPVREKFCRGTIESEFVADLAVECTELEFLDKALVNFEEEEVRENSAEIHSIREEIKRIKDQNKALKEKLNGNKNTLKNGINLEKRKKRLRKQLDARHRLKSGNK